MRLPYVGPEITLKRLYYISIKSRFTVGARTK